MLPFLWLVPHQIRKGAERMPKIANFNAKYVNRMGIRLNIIDKQLIMLHLGR